MTRNTENSPNKIGRKEFMARLVSYFAAGATGGAVVEWLSQRLDQENKPQGFWEEVEIIDGQLTARINAYMNNPDYGIQYVDVTLEDPDGHWHHLCRLTTAELTNSYVCHADISEFITAGGTVTVSFDVVGTNGLVSRAPDNRRELSVG